MSTIVSTGYVAPGTMTVSSMQSCVLACGVSLLFAYLCNFAFQILATYVLEREESERNRIKQKLLQTSRVLYWFAIATFFSIYPPFYQGAHSAVLSWFTLIVVIILHIFCVVDKSCKERSLWSYIYFIFHLLILLWILIALIVGYTWSNAQPAASNQS